MNDLLLKPKYSRDPIVAESIMRIFNAAVITERRLKLHYTSSFPWINTTNAAPPSGEIIEGGFIKDE